MKRLWPFVGVVLGLTVAVRLQAATQIKELMGTYGGNGFFNFEMKDSSAFGDSRSRKESEKSRFFSKTPEVRVEIERLDLDKRWVLDPEKKRYTEESISAAREKERQDSQRRQAEWEKKNKNATPEKASEPTVRIKSIDTKVTGPGSATTINGFSCRPYVIKTKIDYESLPDHKPLGSQTLYEKTWTSEDPLLAKYQKDQMAYWKSESEGVLNRKELQEILKAFQTELAKSSKNGSENPWGSFQAAGAKVVGYPVRTMGAFSIVPQGDASASAPPAPSEAKDDSLVQPGDLSGGVSGVLGGMASRWASKKVQKKVQDKMEEHPAWVDDLSKDFDGQRIGWGWRSEVQSVVSLEASTDLFDVPSGYKKVNSL